MNYLNELVDELSKRTILLTTKNKKIMEQMTYEAAMKLWKNGLGGFAQKSKDDLKGAMDLIKERVDFLAELNSEFVGYAHLNEIKNLLFLYKAAKIVWEKREEDRRILKDEYSASIQEFYSICVE